MNGQIVKIKKVFFSWFVCNLLQFHRDVVFSCMERKLNLIQLKEIYKKKILQTIPTASVIMIVA